MSTDLVISRAFEGKLKSTNVYIVSSYFQTWISTYANCSKAYRTSFFDIFKTEKAVSLHKYLG